MAHIGRPPYTEEQIAAMTSKEEKVRAIAEYKSYNLRLKREVEAQASRPNRYSVADHTGRGGSQPPRKHSNFYEPFSRPNHGGYIHASRGHGSYHPYRRSQPPFKNKTAIFKTSTESSDKDKSDPHSTGSEASAAGRQGQAEPATLCPALTSTGICTRHGCRHRHDPDKQALCKRWLYKDDCSKGEFCPLSHTATPGNAPTCLHFQEGRCNNDDCRFAHVRINPAAHNCEAFGRMGYCEKGNTCTELHAHECPFFSNSGVCSYGDKCRLGHVHRASRMRQTTRPSSNASDSHEEDLDIAEDAQNWMTKCKDPLTYNPQQFQEQKDFVSLDADD